MRTPASIFLFSEDPRFGTDHPPTVSGAVIVRKACSDNGKDLGPVTGSDAKFDVCLSGKHVNHDRACACIGSTGDKSSEFPTRGCVDERETTPLPRVLGGVREDRALGNWNGGPRTDGTRWCLGQRCQSSVSYLASILANCGLRAAREKINEMYQFPGGPDLTAPVKAIH